MEDRRIGKTWEWRDGLVRGGGGQRRKKDGRTVHVCVYPPPLNDNVQYPHQLTVMRLVSPTVICDNQSR